MPDMDGNDVLQYFLDNNIEQKVLMFSGYIDYEFIKNTMVKGAEGRGFESRFPPKKSSHLRRLF
ncbi:hypothetical protein CXF68_09030 [Tenacibaculum sp. Bg11-29]|nr:hypothetical protein CXF68_09030 [Tenacibaculum sp. Bg11-29]